MKTRSQAVTTGAIGGTSFPTLLVVLVTALVCPAYAGPAPGAASEGRLDEAHRMFYSARYEAAAALALEVRTTDPDNLEASEVRTSALHFQIRRILGDAKDRAQAWKQCATCEELLAAFMAELAVGQASARARLAANPMDDDALFLLGKLDLNYVWMQLATVGRKTGWKEYWEARKSLDELLVRNPNHIRGKVARAWIDYIVDTKLPPGTKWMLGGGNRKRGLLTVHEAAKSQAPPFVQAEAMFALWDMQVRERKLPDAVVTARALSRDFPENQELTKFIAANDLRTSR